MSLGTDIRLVVFDLGGVVVRIASSWEEGCAAAGVRHAPQAECEDNAAVVALHCRRHHAGEIDVETFARRVVDAMAGAYDRAEILAVHEAWLGGEYDGVHGVVRALHQRGHATAVLSNTNDAHWQRLQGYPTIREIPQLFASHLLGCVKPDPEAFRAVEQGCGVRGAEILFFDDTEINVETARDIGWHAHRVDPTTPTAPQLHEVLAAHRLLD